MLTPARSSVVFASIGALALGLFELDLALTGAGPYKALWEVQAGALVGIMLGYFLVLWGTLRTGHGVKAVAVPERRLAAFIALAIFAAAAAFLAPLVPSALLAAACKTEVLCPSAANPVLWSYLKLVTGFAIMPTLVIFGVVAAFAIQAGKLWRTDHVA